VSAPAVADLALVARAIDRDGDVLLDLPVSWVVEAGPPTVARPADGNGITPTVVVAVDPDEVRGEELAAGIVGAALEQLADPVVVRVRCLADDVEVVVAHRHGGADVTTVERHHCLGTRGRWVVACTVADRDLVDSWEFAQQVVGSLAVGS
jgi:hypothetical protein